MHRFSTWPNAAAWMVIVFCGPLLAANAAAQSTISFDPAAIEVLNSECSPDTFTVAIVIDDTDPEFQGFLLFVEFDPAVVEPVALLQGLLLQNAGFPVFFTWTNEGEGDDFIQLDVAILGGTADGPGELAQIRFQKIGVGVTPLDWIGITFRDEFNNPIDVVGQSGSAAILDCSVPVEPTSWGRIKSLLQ